VFKNFSAVILQKKEICKKTIAFFVVILLILSGCQSTYNYSVNPDNFHSEDIEYIKKISLKDSSEIYCETLKKKYVKSDTGGAIALLKTDTVFFNKSGEKSYKLQDSTKILFLEDIKKISLEKTETNWKKTALITGGVVLSILVISVIAYIIDPPKQGGL
jgi:hypothetical protein